LEPGRISSRMEPGDHYACSGDETDCSNYRGVPLSLPTTYKTLPTILLSSLTPHSNGTIGIISMDVNLTHQLPITYSACSQILQNKWEPYAAVRRLQGSPHLDSGGIRYSILTESGITTESVCLIKTCLNEIYSKVLIGKCFYDTVIINTTLSVHHRSVLRGFVTCTPHQTLLGEWDVRRIWHEWGRREMQTGFWCETVRERDHWEDLDVNCEAILKFISKKEVGGGWRGVEWIIWLTTVTSGGLLCTR